ncbi:hypothetical protein AK812_SmicGene45139, partial [Symbiodinium microadriaticum]
EFLAKRLLPELEAKNPKDSYTLGVGTHSLFLRYSIGRRADKRYGVEGMPKQLCQSDFALCVPVWQKQMEKPQSPVNKTAAAKGSRISGPGQCETFSMCDHFPQIHSVEQQWTDQWLNETLSSCKISAEGPGQCETFSMCDHFPQA